MKRILPLLAAVALLSGCEAAESGSLPKSRTAAAQIAKGVLTANAQGVVALPASLSSATVDGRAYVTTKAGGRRWILFRTWRGKAANLRGYLYTAGDAPAIGSDVSVTTDIAGVIAPAEVTVDSALGNSWYKGSRSMD